MRIFIAALVLIAAPLTAAAQRTATVSTNAPIYVTKTPAANLAPLRVAAVGTVLKVLGQEAERLQVEFNDPQWGRRVGWVEKEASPRFRSQSNANGFIHSRHEREGRPAGFRARRCLRANA